MMVAPPLRFETLIESYHDEIYSYIWRLLDSSISVDSTVEAQDLTQEVFLRAYKTFEHLRPDSNYRAWLYKIATNCTYTSLKRSQRQTRHSVPLDEDEHEGLADPGPSLDRLAGRNETWATVRQIIAVLPAKQQAAVILRHVHGLDYSEIARVVGCSEDSARANVYQAIRHLRRELVKVQDMEDAVQDEEWR
jgi:RNA polymerase sigma-70 factor (ECF subfamily)